MTSAQRIANVMAFKPVDRLPVFEWAPWWREETVARWRGEGLPEEVSADWEISDYFGLDLHRQYWLRPRTDSCPKPEGHGLPIVSDTNGYQELIDKNALFGEEAFDSNDLRHWSARRDSGEAFVWLTLEGFFWFPRTLLGIEPHMYAFYDQPELMHRMNEDLLAHNLAQLDKFCSICKPDFVTLAEDMSYNHGPMLSKDAFDEFLAPYYLRLSTKLRELGVPLLVDSDGDVTALVSWLLNVGANGILPLERMAGVDVSSLRNGHEKLIMMGGFDKTVMHLGEAAIRKEFDRLLPAMQSGGFLPSCDHQTPPAVSMADYRLYIDIFREYAVTAAK